MAMKPMIEKTAIPAYRLVAKLTRLITIESLKNRYKQQLRVGQKETPIPRNRLTIGNRNQKRRTVVPSSYGY